MSETTGPTFELTDTDGHRYRLRLSALADDTAPDPSPAPDPAPEPEPQPDPSPAPEPDPAPVPEPSPAPDPSPDPDPNPDSVLRPDGITVAVDDQVQIISSAETGTYFQDWSDGRFVPVGLRDHGLFRAARVGAGLIKQDRNYAHITIVARGERAPVRHTVDGIGPIAAEPAAPDQPKDNGSGAGAGSDQPPAPPARDDTPIPSVQITASAARTGRIEASIGDKHLEVSADAGHVVRAKTAAGDWSELTAWNDPALGISAENVLLGAHEDMRGHFKFTLGNEVVYEGALELYRHCATRPQRDFEPQANIRTDLFRNYGTQAANANYESTVLGNSNPDDPMDPGSNDLSIGATGERRGIGPAEAIQAAMMCKHNAGTLTKADLRLLRSEADAANCCPIHYRDPVTLRRMDPRAFPKSTLLWAVRRRHGAQGIADSGSGSPWNLAGENNHAYSMGLGGAAFFDTETDRKNMVDWALHNMSRWQNPGYRLPNTQVCDFTHQSERGIGWGLKTLIDAHIVAPDDALIDAMIGEYGESFHAHYQGVDSRYWLPTHHPYLNSHGTAPWQRAFAVWAMSHAVKNGYEVFRRPGHQFGQIIVDALRYPYPELASIYSVVAIDTDARQLPDWAAMIAETRRQKIHRLHKAMQHPSGSQALQDALHPNARQGAYLPGDLTGYPASPTGYPAILGTGVVACLDLGVPDAPRAYQVYKQRARCDFSWNPQYGLRPAANG